MAHTWDPDRYLGFADERSRPFVELLARVDVAAPATVVDLGCGAANLTALLHRRWPRADVLGLDASPEMIDRARSVPGIRCEVADLRDWRPARPVDVVVSNATLQWVPGHLDLLPRLVDAVTPGGRLAFSVPGNVDEPSHTIRAGLAAESPYAAHTAAAASPQAYDAATYLDALTDLGAEVDAWETTYLHVLTGEDPVLEWISGTSLRPTLQALPPELRDPFTRELGARLREAYPSHEGRVTLPFRRVFAVATIPA